jgi:rhodanese-related sulfurtransferase
MFTRTPRNPDTLMLPRAIAPGRVEVDATWGMVQPIELAPGVRTIGELELIEHAARGGVLVDTRRAHFRREATIAGSIGIDHDEILENLRLLPSAEPAVFFCNGPQCKATPDAVHALLARGHPPEAILYYRGGMHDWITLGYPSVHGD